MKWIRRSYPEHGAKGPPVKVKDLINKLDKQVSNQRGWETIAQFMLDDNEFYTSLYKNQ